MGRPGFPVPFVYATSNPYATKYYYIFAQPKHVAQTHELPTQTGLTPKPTLQSPPSKTVKSKVDFIYLQNGNVTQERLNSLALCQTYRDILDNIDINQLIEQFIISNDRRKYVFGSLIDYLTIIQGF